MHLPRVLTQRAAPVIQETANAAKISTWHFASRAVDFGQHSFTWVPFAASLSWGCSSRSIRLLPCRAEASWQRILRNAFATGRCCKAFPWVDDRCGGKKKSLGRSDDSHRKTFGRVPSPNDCCRGTGL